MGHYANGFQRVIPGACLLSALRFWNSPVIISGHHPSEVVLARDPRY